MRPSRKIVSYKVASRSALWVAGFMLVFSMSAVSAEFRPILKHPLIPWGLAELADGRWLVTDRAGELLMIDGHEITGIEGVPTVAAAGQGGLLDVAVVPGSANQIVLSYAKPLAGGSNTAIYRATLDQNRLVDGRELFVATPGIASTHHFGSRIAILDEFIYFSVGDRGRRDRLPQNPTLDGGKIYRLNVDGSIPNDNPIIEGVRSAVFSYGHRNPQGLAAIDHSVWSHEHGPKGGDELNKIVAGANYGWPIVTHGRNYSGSAISARTHSPEFEASAYQWTPSIAPSDMVFYAQAFYPQLQGRILLGSLKFHQIWMCDLDNPSKCEVLADAPGRVRSLMVTQNGRVIVGVDGHGLYEYLP